MAEPELIESTPAGEPAPEQAPEPEPEPWTPERVLAWNAYYDLYVAAFVLVLIFIVSATLIANSSFWNYLRSGKETISRGAPLTTDIFSYTENGHRWVNVPWLFEVANSALYSAIAPESIDRGPGQLVTADQRAAGAIVAINATLRVLAALLLLFIRRPGPGLWWVAVCTMAAMGGILGPPTGLSLGGIMGPATVTPDSWGVPLLALELFLIDRAFGLGRKGAAYGLIPLFLLWANIDESFATGLLILLAAVLGTLQKPERAQARPIALAQALVVFVACAAVCLVNPSFHRVYAVAFSPLLNLFQKQVGPVLIDQLSVFGPTIREQLPAVYRAFLAYYLILVGLGLASFVLNRRRFSLGRFLMFLTAALLWAALLRFRSEFALVFAITLALNGQEWYRDLVGTEGRLGRGWAIWSVGGRAVTIVLICLFMVKGLTGYGTLPDEPTFGFGTNPDLFPFEAADALKIAKIDGNVLNTSMGQGDALIWRAYPYCKAFIDSRQHVYPPEFRAEFDDLRKSIRDDDIAKWKPLLDKYGVSVVMIEPFQSQKTYESLSNSPNWILFYDDGNAALFGRSDADAKDLAYFKENRLDAQALAFRRSKPVDSSDRPPRLVTWFDANFYDRFFQYRYRAPVQPHVKIASRWLEADAASATIPDPAHCLLAIREARTALARKPDDFAAYAILADAYRLLLLHESAILAGTSLSTANIQQIAPQTELLRLRAFERATALNYAIQSTPPPQTQTARDALRELHFQLGQLYLMQNNFDMGYEQLKAFQDLTNAANLSPQFHTQMTQLKNQLDEVQTRMASLPEAAQADPVQRAMAAQSFGAVGIGIEELDQAEQAQLRVGVVRPMLLDLYCQTGQPDKALDFLGNTNDPNLGAGPGRAAYRQGLISFLLGNYNFASSLWEDHALLQLRSTYAFKALSAGRGLARGDALGATMIFEELPSDIDLEAGWESDLGFCLLESGEPSRAGEHFTRALTLRPNLVLRPVLAYYLEQMGIPVPPLPSEAPATAEKSKDEKPKEPAAPPAAIKPQ